MKLYDVLIKFRNDSVLEFSIGSSKNLKTSISNGWKTDDVFRIGDYFISVNDILWIKVGDGNKSEKLSE